ncbi:MAG: hypothetical protein KJ634_14415 [Gammaproteobacteria bacterium]|nr:hypothetical protein [Gammaproteobacteria bacterium]MBU1416807.1 hypothetical protein [Gammaproteobacteria bacterium]
MRATIFTIVLALMSAVFGCAKPVPLIEEIVFGKYVRVTEDRYEVVTATSFRPGDVYGWVATVKPTRDRVKFREVYEFPVPMEHIEKPTGIETLSISEDGRTIVIEGEIEAGSNVLGHASWTVEHGDPSGPHSMTLSLNGEEVQRFTYSVDAFIR